MEKRKVLHIVSVCVCVCADLVIQHVIRVRHIILGCPTLQNFSTLSDKRHDFRKNLLNIKCVFYFSTIVV